MAVVDGFDIDIAVVTGAAVAVVVHSVVRLRPRCRRQRRCTLLHHREAPSPDSSGN